MVELHALDLLGLGEHHRPGRRQGRVGALELPRVGDRRQVADEVAHRAPGLAARPGRGQLGQPRQALQTLGRLGRRDEEPLAAQADPLDQPPNEDVGPHLLERRRSRGVELQEGLDPVARLGRQLRALERGLERRDHVEPAPAGDRGASREVDRAKLHRRPGQRPDHRGGVGGVGEHPKPREHVADLGPLEQGGVAGESKRDRALLERGRRQPGLSPARADDHADRLGRDLARREQMLDLARGRLRLGPLAPAPPEPDDSAGSLGLSNSAGSRNNSADVLLNNSAGSLAFGCVSVGLWRGRGGRVARLHRDFVPSFGDPNLIGGCGGVRQIGDGDGGAGYLGGEAEGAIQMDEPGLGEGSAKPGLGIDRDVGGRRIDWSVSRGAEDVSVFGGERLDQCPMGGAGVLELIDHEVPKAACHARRGRRPARRAGGAARSRGRRRRGCRSRAAPDRGSRRSRRTRARARCCSRAAASMASRSALSAQSRSWPGLTPSAFSASTRRSMRASRPAGLPRISWRRSERSSMRSRSIARRSANRTVAKNGSSPAWRECSRSNRSAAASKVSHPELLVRAVDQRRGASAQAGGAGPRAGQDQDPLGRGAGLGEASQATGQRLASSLFPRRRPRASRPRRARPQAPGPRWASRSRRAGLPPSALTLASAPAGRVPAGH